MNRLPRSTVLIALALVAGTSLFAQSVPEIGFDANADFLTLPSFGEVAGVLAVVDDQYPHWHLRTYAYISSIFR